MAIERNITVKSDDFREAVTKVKACAAAMTALYLQDAGDLTYSADLFEVLAGQLYDAANVFNDMVAEVDHVEGVA